MRCLNCMKTFKGDFEICPHCGYVRSAQPEAAFSLQPGTVLHERYIVGTAVGVGGFGITYRAWDQALEKQVAIKEYFPNGVVNRVPGNPEVIVFSEEGTGEFQKGRVRFLAEAENMAKFNSHPNIVDVYDFFEENRTAYIVMEFLDGMSFKTLLSMYEGERMPYRMAAEIVTSVLKALKEIHKKKIVHRDISPDNVFILPLDAHLERYIVKVIDFGAARLSDGEEEKTLSIILKPGFAPPEQYEKKSKQGPWTDFYAVGAMLYLAVTGKKPDESLNRALKDELVPPIKLVTELPQYLNDTILRAMALRPELRFRNADQFLEALNQKKGVRTVEQELRRRRMILAAKVGGVCLAVCGIGLLCRQVYVYRQTMVYRVAAELSVQMPDTNARSLERVEQAGALGASAQQDKKQLSYQDSGRMLGDMLEEYGESFRNIEISRTDIQAFDRYEDCLEEQAGQGKLPAVFESTEEARNHPELWQAMGSLSDAYETLDKREYYFMGDKEFEACFEKEKKQIPVSFCAPVLYVNTNLAPQTEGMSEVTSLEELTLDGRPGYCVSAADREMYREAFQAEAEDEAFAVSAGDGSSGASAVSVGDGGSGTAAVSADEYGYEPFLRREKAYYLGTTDDYEAIRASLGGIYEMVVLEKLQEEGRVKGRFTHFWSISGELDREERAAANYLVYYLMGERAQDIFNVQNGNGLSLNKEIMKVYVENNDEFREVERHLKNLRMEYPN